MKTLYTSHVSVTGGRDGAARSTDGRLDVRLGFPRELGGAGDAVNPEELFAAGWAACFASSIRAAAAALKLPAAGIRIDAEVDLAARDDGAYTIGAARFAVHGGVFGEQADAVIAEAKRICAYSNATRGNVELHVQLAAS